MAKGQIADSGSCHLPSGYLHNVRSPRPPVREEHAPAGPRRCSGRVQRSDVDDRQRFVRVRRSSVRVRRKFVLGQRMFVRVRRKFVRVQRMFVRVQRKFVRVQRNNVDGQNCAARGADNRCARRSRALRRAQTTAARQTSFALASQSGFHIRTIQDHPRRINRHPPLTYAGRTNPRGGPLTRPCRTRGEQVGHGPSL